MLENTSSVSIVELLEVNNNSNNNNNKYRWLTDAGSSSPCVTIHTLVTGGARLTKIAECSTSWWQYQWSSEEIWNVTKTTDELMTCTCVWMYCNNTDIDVVITYRGIFRYLVHCVFVRNSNHQDNQHRKRQHHQCKCYNQHSILGIEGQVSVCCRYQHHVNCDIYFTMWYEQLLTFTFNWLFIF